MSANRRRAWRADKTLNRYAALSGTDDTAEAITDRVADVGPFCVENDPAYLYLLARGVSHWRLEMTDPESLEMPAVTITINESNDHA